METPNTNTLRITDEIVLATPKGTMAGFRWDGIKLANFGGKELRFNANKSAEIDAAVKSYIPDTYRKAGVDISDGPEDFIIRDNYKSNRDGSGTIVVEFDKSDLA